MKFNDYRKSLTEDHSEINEAKFNAKDLKKVSDLLAKIASKKLGANFQPAWMDDFKKANGRIGLGFRYLSPEGKQIRFNHLINSKAETFMVNSVDYWEKGAEFLVPSITIEFADDINIVKLKDKLFDAISQKKIPSLTYSELAESLEFNKEMSEATKAELKRQKRIEFAQKHGLDVTKADKYGNSWLQRAAEEIGVKDEYTDWMKFDTNMPEKTKFDQKIKEDQSILNDPNIYAEPKYVFQDMEQAALTVAKGKWRSAIFGGSPGIGKTFGVKQVLTQTLGPYGEGPDGKCAFYEGLKTSGFGLFKLLLLNKKKLIVFDDSDSIWGDKNMINMMKIVTSDSGDRTISWTSNSTANVSLMSTEERQAYEQEYLEAFAEDPNTLMKPPSSFNFEGQIINISNMKADKFDDAIKSRAIFIDVYLAQRDVIRRMASIKKQQGMDEATIKLLLEALDPSALDALEGKGKYAGEVKYITPEIARKSKQLNMRSLNIAQALMESGAKDWSRMAQLYA